MLYTYLDPFPLSGIRMTGNIYFLSPTPCKLPPTSYFLSPISPTPYLMSTVNPNEDRLKKLLRTNMMPPPTPVGPTPQNHVEVNVNGYISPIANIKVV